MGRFLPILGIILGLTAISISVLTFCQIGSYSPVSGFATSLFGRPHLLVVVLAGCASAFPALLISLHKEQHSYAPFARWFGYAGSIISLLTVTAAFMMIFLL